MVSAKTDSQTHCSVSVEVPVLVHQYQSLIKGKKEKVEKVKKKKKRKHPKLRINEKLLVPSIVQ